MTLPRIPSDAQLRNKFHGCLLGGAVGDALGAPVEFLDLDEIVRVYGEAGIRDYAPAYGKLGSITDDTQMTLFTAEAMLSAHLDSALNGQLPDFFRAATASYARWLMTQENSRLISSPSGKASWLLQQKKLFSRRAPGTTCLSALQTSRGKVTRAANDSKGCGGVMRIAPAGMYFAHALSREQNHDKLIPRSSLRAAISPLSPMDIPAAASVPACSRSSSPWSSQAALSKKPSLPPRMSCASKNPTRKPSPPSRKPKLLLKHVPGIAAPCA